ncbi:hypothetical protein QCA50_012940 [Cerrena zonata]|uniref:Acetyltransferase n=1 Tax=Cerrena zonata TaxID=2478898 RepID=A0AAW0G0P8_9APHY
MTNEINKELVQYAYANLQNLPKGQEYEKMILGVPYNAGDKTLNIRRVIAKELSFNYSQIRLKDCGMDLDNYQQYRYDYLKKVFGKVEEDVYIEPPFNVDYGSNVKLGKKFYANVNVTFLDCSLITFGDYVNVGPNCVFSSATHPTQPDQRLAGVEYALPISIGHNVWFGANITVLPGITIGNNAVIGAGSLVNKDIPDNAIAVGVPAKVIKIMKLSDEHDNAIAKLN